MCEDGVIAVGDRQFQVLYIVLVLVLTVIVITDVMILFYYNMLMSRTTFFGQGEDVAGLYFIEFVCTCRK